MPTVNLNAKIVRPPFTIIGENDRIFITIALPKTAIDDTSPNPLLIKYGDPVTLNVTIKPGRKPKLAQHFTP